MISQLISLPYELTRRPLVAVGDGLTGRLREDAAPRVLLDRVVGSTDRVVGGLLHDRSISERGSERLQRSAGLADAAALEQEAQTKRATARHLEEAGRQEAEARREDARDTLAHGLDEADAVEAQAKRDARAAATRAASAKKASAKRAAAARQSAAEQRKAQAEKAATAKERAAQKQASEALEEARENQQAAATDRRDADRLEKLTEAKKAERKRS